MSDLALFFAFYSPEHGVNFPLLAAWAIAALLSSTVLFPKALAKLEATLLKLLNKIPFFEKTDLDEWVLEMATKKLGTKVQSQMSAAKALKNEYHLKIKSALDAGDHLMVDALSKEMLEKLEELTTKVKDEFFEDGENLLWKKLEERYGDKAKAGKWVVDKIKALVRDLKEPNHPSTSELIAKHLFGAGTDLGK